MKEDEIDLIALVKKIWQSRIFLFKFLSASIIIGLLVAILSPVQYTAASSFIPTSGNTSKSGSLGGLASLAGINIDLSSAGDEIPVALYPNILKSAPYKLALLESYVRVENDSMTVRDYFKNKPTAFLSYIKKYTIGLPGLILGAFKNDKSLLKEQILLQIDTETQGFFKLLDAILVLTVNEKEGFVEISFSDSDPFIAAQITNSAQSLLQRKIISQRTEFSMAQYKYTSQQYELKKQEFRAIQKEVAVFKDRNSAIGNAQFQTKLQQLEAEYSIINAVYTELAKNLEQTKLQINKDTPIFSVLNPVIVPYEKSAPKRLLLIVIYSFLGLVIGMGYILIKEPLGLIKKEITTL
jgi:uncharacterized protein involved in exopolysaccharide biosynthesis